MKERKREKVTNEDKEKYETLLRDMFSLQNGR